MSMHHVDCKSILVVDDDREVCDLLKGLLVSEDRIVYTATSLADASEILRRDKIDLVLLDLYLPDGNGIDFLARLKSSASEPSAIIMTAFGNWETHVRAYHLGAYYYLDKPFKITQVRFLVEQALREKTLQ